MNLDSFFLLNGIRNALLEIHIIRPPLLPPPRHPIRRAHFQS